MADPAKEARAGRIASIAAPLCLFSYGVGWLLDGMQGFHGPGLFWSIGHAFFLLTFAALAFVVWDLRARVGTGNRLALSMAVVAFVGLALFLRVGAIDLLTGFAAADHAAMAPISRRLNAWPDPRLMPLFQLGPLLFQLGLMALLVQLAVMRRLPWRAPLLVLAGFVVIGLDLKFLTVGAVLIGLGFQPLTRNRETNRTVARGRRGVLRQAALILGGTIAAMAVAAAAIVFAFLANFHHFAPRASYPTPTSPLEAQRQDLDYFDKAMALDRSFSRGARTDAEARVAALKSAPQALPPAKLQVALMQVMATADNGHSRMRPTGDRGTLVLPVRVTRFAEGFYVMRADAPDSDLLGGRVESIDGMAFDEILPRLETLRGGVEGFRRENAAIFIVVQDLLFGLDIAKEPKASTWTVRLPDGPLVTRRLTAYPLRKGEQLPHGSRWLSPEPRKGVEHNWTAYQPQTGALPETWRQLDTHFRLFKASGSCADVVRLQDISDADGQEIAPFLSATEATLKTHPPCALILDLRGDTGGDYTKAWHFAQAIPALLGPRGRIFVLTDPDTFSAAITTAAFVKQAGGRRVTIVGEPVGDRLSFYSEGGEACLPNLKVCVDYQAGKHDYAHACDDWRECYWLNWFYPVRVASLQPDVFVARRFEDWNAGRDAVYSRSLELVSPIR